MDELNREPLKAGDNVTEKALLLDHTLRCREKADTHEEAAKVMGVNAKTITRRLQKSGQPYLKYTRGTKQRAARPAPNDYAENSTDD